MHASLKAEFKELFTCQFYSKNVVGGKIKFPFGKIKLP